MAYMLAEHPAILEKLREEILDKVGPSQRPTFNDIKDMKYLRAVLNGRCFSAYLGTYAH
jgi:hypothetical protein